MQDMITPTPGIDNAYQNENESISHWNQNYIEDDNDWYTKFIRIVYRVFQQSFPLVRVSRERFKDKPWMTKGLRISIKHKNRLYRAQLLRPGLQQIVQYNTYTMLPRKCLKEAETIYYKDIFENNKNSVYNIW